MTLKNSSIKLFRTQYRKNIFKKILLSLGIYFQHSMHVLTLFEVNLNKRVIYVIYAKEGIKQSTI